MFKPILITAFALSTSSAFAVDGKQIALEGNGKGALACVTCHGAQGEGQDLAGFPRLAGLNAAYLSKQLNDFVNGSRSNPVMQPMANSLTSEERKAVVEYYSQLPTPTKETRTSEPNPLGEQLALWGRWEQQVPACIQCHGKNGVGVGAHFPPIAGQSAIYIANQLKEWQTGARANDPLGLMKHVADNLNNEDIQAVAKYFANQNTVLAGEK